MVNEVKTNSNKEIMKAYRSYVKKESKFDRFYLLRMLNHKKYFYAYEEFYTKQELFILCCREFRKNGYFINSITLMNKLK